MSDQITRRGLAAGAAATGGLLLAGCDRLSQSRGGIRRVLELDDAVNYHAQRLLEAGQPLAREFRERDVSPVFKVNGSSMPQSADYQRLMKGGFQDWRLVIDGLVERPLTLSLDQIQKLPARTQITRHDCVEGWSCIGKWTGMQLGPVLRAVGLKPHARYVVFHCADDGPGSGDPYYESIDLVDAFHPQTLLAYRMNDQPLTVGHGAPLRLRLERQLGYKQAKYVMRVEVVDTMKGLFGGKGGFWEDRGYEWYAGI